MLQDACFFGVFESARHDVHNRDMYHTIKLNEAFRSERHPVLLLAMEKITCMYLAQRALARRHMSRWHRTIEQTL